MLKVFVAVFSFLVVLCSFYVQASAESGHGGAPAGMDYNNTKAGDLLGTTAIDSHFKEVYTTLDPYQGHAEKYFYASETIYFVGEIYLPTPGVFDACTIITDAGGKVVLFDGYTYIPTSSNWYFYFSTDSLPAGNYNVNILVSVSGGFLLTPVAFGFVVL